MLPPLSAQSLRMILLSPFSLSFEKGHELFHPKLGKWKEQVPFQGHLLPGSPPLVQPGKVGWARSAVKAASPQDRKGCLNTTVHSPLRLWNHRVFCFKL